MSLNKKVFISFPIEDVRARDFLVGQSRNANSPFVFVDESVKKPWDSSWKTHCRTKIKSCNGVVGIITKNTPQADGQLWELKCSYDEDIPVMLMYGSNDRPNLPYEIKSKRINIWNWENIRSFIDRL